MAMAPFQSVHLGPGGHKALWFPRLVAATGSVHLSCCHEANGIQRSRLGPRDSPDSGYLLSNQTFPSFQLGGLCLFFNKDFIFYRAALG